MTEDFFEMTVREEWLNMNLQDIFKSDFQAPKKLTHLFRMDKRVLINGEVANWTKPINRGDKLKLKLFTNEEASFIPTEGEVNPIYEDEHIIVVNKQKGVKTHPNDKKECDTLANYVAHYLLEKGERSNVRHVHRLDKDTSGLIIFAKHELIGSILDNMLAKNEVKRFYLALTDGIVKNKFATINSPIGRDRHHPTRRRISKTGQEAITNYKVLHYLEKENKTLLACELLTGRTHQIRVHLSSIGHPLIGDKLYNKNNKTSESLALHAAKLQFLHPFTKEDVNCYAQVKQIGHYFEENHLNEIVLNL